MTDAQAKTIGLDRAKRCMPIMTGCCGVLAGVRPLRPSVIIRTRNYLREKMLTFYRRHFYRSVMRFMHRFNWHYAPPSTLPDERPGVKHHWCQWCGLRGDVIRYE